MDRVRGWVAWQNAFSTCLVFILSWSSSQAFAQADDVGVSGFHVWFRYVRGFRQGHNFSSALGVSSAEWRIRSFGPLTSYRTQARGYLTNGRYSFHLPIVGRFGYILGSSFAFQIQENRENSRVYLPNIISFPGLAIGLVYNFSPSLRLSVLADQRLVRIQGIRAVDLEEGQIGDEKIHITMQSYEASVALDSFFSLNWAARMQFASNFSVYVRPEQAKGFGLDASIKRSQHSFTIGLLYHLL